MNGASAARPPSLVLLQRLNRRCDLPASTDGTLDHYLFALLNGTYRRTKIALADLPDPTLQALKSHLESVDVSLDDSSCSVETLVWSDDYYKGLSLYHIGVELDDAEVYVADFLYDGANLLAKDERVSG